MDRLDKTAVVGPVQQYSSDALWKRMKAHISLPYCSPLLAERDG
jgi:hypothetical protein